MEQKVQIKFVINLSVPRYPKCARARGRGGAALSTRKMRHRWYRRGLQGRGWISAVCGGAVGCVYIYDAFNENICLYIKMNMVTFAKII